MWQSQVEEFTHRKLTKQSDRITAFLAISEVLCNAGGDKFAGALWTGKHLIASMCWELERADEADIRGPSWTWGSRSSAVSNKLCRHPGRMMPKPSVISINISIDRSHINISGFITLRGFLGVWRPDNIPSSRSWPMFGTAISECFDQTSESQDNLYIFGMLKSGKTPKSPPFPGAYPASPKNILLVFCCSLSMAKT